MGAQYKKIAVAACLIMSAMIAGSVSFGFFMDPVTADLGFSRGSFSIYFSLVTIVGAITLPVYGRIVPRIGVRKVVIAGGLWTGVCMACFSFCSSLPMFYGVACLVGLGFFGCSYIAAPVVVDTWFRKKNGAVMGAAAACGGLVGVALGFVFPQIIEVIGWRAGYVAQGVMVAALTVPAGIFLLRSTPQEMGLQPYGAEEAALEEAAAGEGTADGEAGMTPAQAFKSPKLWAAVLAFLMFTITVSVTQHLAAYFVSIGFEPTMAGVFMSIISAGIIVTNAATGAISDKIGLMKTIILCSILYAASFALLPDAGMGFVLICVALFFMSLGNAYTSIFAPVVTSVAFGKRNYAAIWGIISMACVLGQAIGTPLWGVSFDMTGGYQFGMVVAAVLNIIGMFLLIATLKVKGGKGEQKA
ncbi:MAG: MFS transporter [Coriobacteriales bacterium]